MSISSSSTSRFSTCCFQACCAGLPALEFRRAWSRQPGRCQKTAFPRSRYLRVMGFALGFRGATITYRDIAFHFEPDTKRIGSIQYVNIVDRLIAPKLQRATRWREMVKPFRRKT